MITAKKVLSQITVHYPHSTHILYSKLDVDSTYAYILKENKERKQRLLFSTILGDGLVDIPAVNFRTYAYTIEPFTPIITFHE